MWLQPGSQHEDHPLAASTRMGERFAYWGSDKSTFHAYDPIYERLLSDRVDEIQLVLEIGVADGGSVLAWRDIFPSAHIVGLDLAPCNHPSVTTADRLELHVGDMRDHATLQRVAAGRSFDLIVEDASHKLDDNLRALFVMLPMLASGGLYVIEEFDRQAPVRENLLEWRPHIEALGGTVYDTVARGKAPGGEALFVFAG